MCNCIETANEEFKPHNVRICSTSEVSKKGLGRRRVLLATVKADGKNGQATPVVAQYCPFCGSKYENG
jgi:hypothetical protein